ncbi:hypothetical protein NC652_031432 [Populus alba x Populus x berolinensis]|nr:hypothetical protein NC652_031427 [Populus alba x Populus x berolinensis]KAJ6884416.1 hypothetical protein NC652_031429 [Populus alba x Populus x berolinensis]KAJ6884419.1 hypothetical protein NC652_031432 [Populus alba x Populus x berolinensis]
MDFFFDYKPTLQAINNIVSHPSCRTNGTSYIII